MHHLGLKFDETFYTEADLGLQMPPMPYFVDLYGQEVSDTLNIHKYIALLWSPELLGPSPREEEFLENSNQKCLTLKTLITKHCYSGKDDPKIEASLGDHAAGVEALLKVNGFDLFLEHVSYLDFYLFEICNLI